MFGDQMVSDSYENLGREKVRAASYLLEVLLDENNHVRRTRIHHVQSGLEATWDNWDETRFLDFFKRRPELRLTKLSKAAKIAQPDEIKEAKPVEIKADTVAAASLSSPATGSPRTGSIRINRLEIIPEQSIVPRRSFGAKQSFNVRLHLDLAEMRFHGQEPFEYTVALLAKRIGSERQQEFLRDRHDYIQKQYDSRSQMACFATRDIPNYRSIDNKYEGR